MRQLLLVPLLAPLLAVLLIGAFNPRPAVALRLLIWTSPSLPIGVWMILAAAGGAGLSALGTGLALSGEQRLLQRQVRRPAAGAASAWGRGRGPAERPDWIPEDPDRGRSHAPPQGQPQSWTSQAAGPTRAAGDSSPTVAVPYRVIRRGGAAAPESAEPRTGSASPSAAPAAPVTTGDGWNTPLPDSW